MTDPLDDLLAEMPSPDASESEIAAFMEKVMATPGGAEVIQDFAQKITAGGSLDTMLKEEEREQERRALKSPARFIFRVELVGTKPLIWRRMSLPADCSFAHLHQSIQDALGWSGNHEHRFEIWEDGELEITFSSADDPAHYCESENRIMDLFHENVAEFRYLYDFQSNWQHRVVIEDFVPAGEKGTSQELRPILHAGEGHGPPEETGGVKGYQKFLSGDHPVCANYDAEILEQFWSGSVDLSQVIFR